MKIKHIMPFIALLLLTLSFACDNSNDPDPTPVYSGPRICARDSVALTDIYFQAFGEMPIRLYKTITSESRDKEWILRLELDEEKSEYIVTRLIISSEIPLSATDFKAMKLSPRINELCDITEFFIYGKSFQSDFPSINKLDQLKILIIGGTNFQSLPDDIFTENLEEVDITGNFQMSCELPSSISKLNGRTKASVCNYAFILKRNAFTGKVPTIPNASVDLTFNNFDSYSLGNLQSASLKYCGVNANYNRIKQEVPKEILEDTLSLLVLYREAGRQIDTNGFIGMPSDEKIGEMFNKYIEDHPDAID